MNRGIMPLRGWHTITALLYYIQVVVIGDGQATQNDFVVKANVTKVRRIGDTVIGGFAGGWD